MSASADALLRAVVVPDGMYSGARPDSCVGELRDGTCRAPGTKAGALALAASASPPARIRGADVTRGEDAAGAFIADGNEADALPASAGRASTRTPLTADANDVAGEKPEGVPAVAEPIEGVGATLTAVRGVATGVGGMGGGAGRVKRGC